MQIANLKAKVSSIVQGDNDNILTKNSLGKKMEVISANFKMTPTIFAKDLSIEGNISSSGLIEIEGKVKGAIKGNSVIIREGGFVDGEIFAETLSIKGNFEGDIKAKNINISSKAKLIGNIEYQSLSVEDGACIDGKFKQVNLDS